MNTLTDLTIGEALVKLKRREISPVELTQAYIESMESNKNIMPILQQRASRL